MYCSAHKDIQPNQIQWILGRLLITGISWDLLTHECSTIKSTRHDNFHAPFHRQGCGLHTNGLFMGWAGFFTHHTAKDSEHISSASSIRVGLWSVLTDLSPVLGGVFEEFIFKICSFEYQKRYFVTVALCHVTDKMPQGRQK